MDSTARAVQLVPGTRRLTFDFAARQVLKDRFYFIQRKLTEERGYPLFLYPAGTDSEYGPTPYLGTDGVSS
eukprot:3032923-Rhodomonas_salina.3